MNRPFGTTGNDRTHPRLARATATIVTDGPSPNRVVIYDTTVRYVQFTYFVRFTTENFLFKTSAASLALK
jgi:hypothetical protein